MGQSIKAVATILDDVALVETDRSLNGQDGRAFTGLTKLDGFDALLANRLYEVDGSITSIHVLSNMVSIVRAGGWGEIEVDRMLATLESLFEFYPTGSVDEQLRERHYNATIASIRTVNEELWVMRIRPDVPVDSYSPGQYTTLALGYWETRGETVADDPADDRTRLARRSYSVSSSIIDIGTGQIVEPPFEEVEFYIVKVPPSLKESPALTPRLFQKSVGDRIFMGTKFAGRYTLDGVGVDDQVVFLSTGTGEAPQNAMTAALIRSGHRGPILNLVCVRLRRDLGYLREHRLVSESHPQYRYETLTTREPENLQNKIYIQDLVQNGGLDQMLDSPLDPDTTHIFLCGNPVMIGLPTWDDDNPTFPEQVGVCELLHERGFTIDHGKKRGNVHYEEYWKGT